MKTRSVGTGTSCAPHYPANGQTRRTGITRRIGRARKMGSYRERLLVPVSYWLLAVPVVVTLGAEAYFFVDGFIPPLVIVVLYLIVAAFLVNWSSATIEVTDEVLRAGRDTLALSEIGEAIALDDKQAMALRGPRADPAAHILLRPYLKRAVYIG